MKTLINTKQQLNIYLFYLFILVLSFLTACSGDHQQVKQLSASFPDAADSNSIWKGKIGKTQEESTPYKIDYLKKAPAGAPNIIWILLDDVGFGASSAFGGVIHTPTFDSLANNGLRYTNFHTTAICSPTRSALLTGRNHHSVHFGLFPHYILSQDFPGYDAHLPAEKGTVAEVLHENGYSTYQLGKWHLTPDEETTDLGPFDRWPSGKGFDHNFGFLGGATDQYQPDLVEDNQHIKPDGRHLNELLVDKTIQYLDKQKALAPAKPFFVYLAPGATHAPHQVDKKWSDKYKGKFDNGWDALREQIFANQKKLGVIPASAQLPARNARVDAWKDLPADQQKLFAHFAEVYAGFLEYTDYEIGRLLNHLKENGQLDNTAVFVILGDNGASKEGTEYGVVTKSNSFRSNSDFTKAAYLKFVESEAGKIGTKEVSQQANYPIGFAQAFNTPFKQWKQDANSEGGTHNPLIVYYPKGIQEKGGIRNQYGHVIDILPTTLELIGLKLPAAIEGIKQDSLQGTSLFYSINDAKAPSRHTLQYYNIFGARAIYKDGWKAAATHHPDYLDVFSYADAPAVEEKSYDEDEWELYNLNEDFNEINNLASKNPEKLKELKEIFDQEAKKYNVYPFYSWKQALIKIKETAPRIAATTTENIKSKKLALK
jgi:arylsulfatase A-like enzyme